jgi:hypothetical protein
MTRIFVKLLSMHLHVRSFTGLGLKTCTRL